MDSKLNLDVLPPEVVTQFLLRLSLKDLANYCLTSKTANAYCQSDAFWKDKYRYDFGFSSRGSGGLNSLPLPKNPTKLWINLYKERANRSSPISVGQFHYAMIDNQGILYMVGQNRFYQLGDGTDDDTKTPIRISFFTIGRGSPHGISPTTDYSSKEQVTKKVISVSCGEFFTLAITEDGKTYRWGTFLFNDEDCKIKMPTLIPDLENYKAIKVSCGGEGWAVILDNGSVYYSIVMTLCGKQIMGIVPLKENVIDISVNSSKLGIVTSSGKLYVFGRDFSGKLRGIVELPDDEFAPEIGGSPIDPILFPPDLARQGEISKSIIIKQVSLSKSHIMALSTNGDIFSWGDNDEDQLGLNEGIYPGYIHPTPQKIPVPVKFSYIGVHDKMSYAITTHGKLYIWGGDHYIIKDQLKLMPSNEGKFRIILGNLVKSPLEISIGHRVNYVAFGYSFAIAVTEDGMVNYMGEPYFGPPI